MSNSPATQPAEKFSLQPYLIRLLLIGLVSTLFVAIFNEAVYMLQKEEYDRPPKTIQVVIPAGTAERVAAGESVPSIPSEMVFVVGDVLEVVNHDNVSHTLDPLVVPPGSSARMVMGREDKFASSCSFQSTRYLNIDVRKPTTLGTRITALGLAAPTMTALIYIYSLVIFPVGAVKKPKASEKLSSSARARQG